MLEQNPVAVITALAHERTTKRDHVISADTALYHDLRIWGDDAYEILKHLDDLYGTDFSRFDFALYFPCEGLLGDFFAWRRKDRRPKLTVGDLAEAVRLGIWRSE